MCGMGGDPRAVILLLRGELLIPSAPAPAAAPSSAPLPPVPLQATQITGCEKATAANRQWDWRSQLRRVGEELWRRDCDRSPQICELPSHTVTDYYIGCLPLPGMLMSCCSSVKIDGSQVCFPQDVCDGTTMVCKASP